MDYIQVGEILGQSPAPESLEYDESRRLLAACLINRAFKVVELRRVTLGEKSSPIVGDVIVVDCADGTVPSRNAAGIKNRERLALIYAPSDLLPHNVWALRSDFPVTLHQNQMPQGHASSLCLYFESWPAVRRSWTPERHLQRILWWLRETANGTLHRDDQPIEQFYFTAEFEVVLPYDFVERAADPELAIQLAKVSTKADEFKVVRSRFVSRNGTSSRNENFVDILAVSVNPVSHANVEKLPYTLGDIHDQLSRRGSELLNSLKSVIKERYTEPKLKIQNDPKSTLLVLSIPRLRSAEGEAERIDVRGFMLTEDIPSIGMKLGIFMNGMDGYAYQNITIGSCAAAEPDVNGVWRNIKIAPMVEVKTSTTKEYARRASGVLNEGSEFHGTLAGVGALGSVLADVWSREGWGSWTYIDDDILKVHNVVRHAGKDHDIGRYKADIVSELVSMNYSDEIERANSIVGKIEDANKPEVEAAIRAASILVDATTTLYVPRDLSQHEFAPRIASVFLTPSGKSSVMLLEDRERRVRLHSLESQYYRAILNCEWGANHLTGHYGNLVVGGGCRDVSSVISNELILLHGASLARQVRLKSIQSDPQIRVLDLDEETGALASITIQVHQPIIHELGEWKVVWDEGLRVKLYEERSRGLPNETGGVLFGYHDQKLKMVFVVDSLPAPPDSEASKTGFTRGMMGISESLSLCAEKTAHVVGYVGEWHSHPPRSSSRPSGLDVNLLADLAYKMALDGLPALMMIVAEDDVAVMTCSSLPS